MEHPLLLLHGISLTHQQGFRLSDISLRMVAGEHLAVIGASGSGKTTLLKIIAGLLDADEGTAQFDGQKITGPLYNLIPGHSGIGYLSQHYELRNNYQVEDYLDYGSQMTAQEASQIFDACHISHLLGRKTNSGLSGGEKQRIALAKILLTKPTLLLLDEPFSNLDQYNKVLLQQVLAQLEENMGITYLMVLHEPKDVLAWAQQIVVMQHGSIVQTGSPQVVYYAPSNAYVAALLGDFQMIAAEDAMTLGNHSVEPPGEVTVRPAHIQLLNQGEPAQQATIAERQFAGSHYRFLVRWRHYHLVAHAAWPLYDKGDKVYVQWHPNSIH